MLETLSLMGMGFIHAMNPLTLVLMIGATALGITIGCHTFLCEFVAFNGGRRRGRCTRGMNQNCGNRAAEDGAAVDTA